MYSVGMNHIVAQQERGIIKPLATNGIENKLLQTGAKKDTHTQIIYIYIFIYLFKQNMHICMCVCGLLTGLHPRGIFRCPFRDLHGEGGHL